MTTQAPIKILIADDHPIFRHGLRMLLSVEPEFQIVGEASDGEEAVQLTRKLHPDVLLLDLHMPRLPGLETLRELATSRDPVRTILLTATIEKQQIVEALQLGARGIVLKEAATQVLFTCIRTVMRGRFWVDRDSVPDLVESLRSMLAAPAQEKKEGFGLTPRELEIVSAIVTGHTNRDIAEKLKISEQTVKHHLRNIFDKVGVSNRLELALFAINHRLVPA